MHYKQNGAVVTIGNGPNHVIALHGWFGHARGWGPFVDVLDGDRFTYAFIDYRGYGSRRGIQGRFDMREIAADVLALGDELGWQRFSLIGHSMGGKAMQAVAMLAPARVTAMVGVTPVPPAPVPFDQPTRALFERAAGELAARIAVLGNSTGERLSRHWVEKMARASTQHADADAFAAYFRAWADTDFSAEVAGTSVPTLLLVGEHDPSLTADVMEQTYGKAFLDLAIDVIRNAGHYPMDETPVDLATRIERFLSDIQSRSKP
ncbi:alpha/beta hydrolase [Cupriavidus necator]|uniref:Alpha/beta hydrolase n=1 Tax=Cupriavidus necator TaxID=106590 RepID=A0A367PPK3_CUPNE|nr:alpha/beta hydrolase [Cupriavidus necator]QQX87740.1 alpha/beta hydrolase [Cupriavidus necator]RCJ08956.1 alpha/beta hydrolase [Cupriavidus necator]